MSQWGGKQIIPTALGVNVGNAPTLSTGNEKAGVLYSGSDIDSNIGAVTDITDPAGTGGWTDLIDLSSGPYLVQFYNDETMAIVDSAEDVGDSIAIEILVDGNTILSGYCVGNGASDVSIRVAEDLIIESNERNWPIFARSSILCRVARKGAFANAGSKLGAAFFYRSVQEA